MTARAADDALVAFWRGERVRVLAALVKFTRGDVDAAEDALAEAAARAVAAWGERGVPERPGAWMLTTARRVLIDAARRRATADASEPALQPTPAADPQIDEPPPGMDDDRLALLCACCHPALSELAQVALALRTVGGLTAREIARAYLEPEATVAQRLVRATRKLRDAGIPVAVPVGEALVTRAATVRQVLYFLFNEGYASASTDGLLRESVCEEAVAITRLLVAAEPDDAESLGLLALQLLHHARRAARLDAAGDLVPLEEQDRSRWDRALIAEGEATLDRALALRQPGPYQVQAAIAALHATAPTSADTDWAQINLLYARLRFWWPTPVVELNAAVALAMARGVDWGLHQLEVLATEPAMAGYHLLPAARADLLRRAGRWAEAAQAYVDAIPLARAPTERRFLERRLREVEAQRARSVLDGRRPTPTAGT